MKFIETAKKVSLIIISSLCLSLFVFGQQETPSPTPQVSKKSPTENPKTDVPQTEPVVVKTKQTDESAKSETSSNNTEEKKDDSKKVEDDVEDTEIKNAIVPYYTNYLTKYELGPEDVISIEVFGQCEKGLCKTISVPPTAIINFPFIPGGLFVGGKTTNQIAQEIAKKLDEYIIDPQVTVNLEKVVSAQFAVLGKVATPGVRTMTKRYSVVEAITEAGSFVKDADMKRIMLYRRGIEGSYTTIPIKYEMMRDGKVPMEYLSPGDQIFIPEKKWSLTKVLEYVSLAAGFRMMAPVPMR